jgi:hypothetical protein
MIFSAGTETVSHSVMGRCCWRFVPLRVTSWSLPQVTSPRYAPR